MGEDNASETTKKIDLQDIILGVYKEDGNECLRVTADARIIRGPKQLGEMAFIALCALQEAAEKELTHDKLKIIIDGFMKGFIGEVQKIPGWAGELRSEIIDKGADGNEGMTSEKIDGITNDVLAAIDDCDINASHKAINTALQKSTGVPLPYLLLVAVLKLLELEGLIYSDYFPDGPSGEASKFRLTRGGQIKLADIRRNTLNA